mmetsp:Transcript_35572/g.81526  ORF Transcript_35572/g.81526 Transcript_35572/m.81526 type:complete len:203 (+) Transcript_35572:577-1185(+)
MSSAFPVPPQPNCLRCRRSFFFFLPCLSFVDSQTFGQSKFSMFIFCLGLQVALVSPPGLAPLATEEPPPLTRVKLPPALELLELVLAWLCKQPPVCRDSSSSADCIWPCPSAMYDGGAGRDPLRLRLSAHTLVMEAWPRRRSWFFVVSGSPNSALSSSEHSTTSSRVAAPFSSHQLRTFDLKFSSFRSFNQASRSSPKAGGK